MPALVFRGENPRYVIQPSQHRGPGMPGGLGSSQIGYREQKFSFQLRKKISYYYFHLGNRWVDAMLVLGRKRRRFTRREMPVIFPTPCQRLMYVQEPAPNIFFYTSEKKNSLAENEYILMSSSLECLCCGVHPSLSVWGSSYLPPTAPYTQHMPCMWSASFCCTQES